MIRFMRRRRGLSPVIATIILSGVVIAVGGSIWSFSRGASTVMANQYVNSTLSVLNEVTERFTVEYAYNNSNGEILYVCVYNYGDVDVVVDVYANATHFVNSSYTSYVMKANYFNSVNDKVILRIELDFSSDPLEAGDMVSIKVHSRRQNNAFYKHYV